MKGKKSSFQNKKLLIILWLIIVIIGIMYLIFNHAENKGIIATFDLNNAMSSTIAVTNVYPVNTKKEDMESLEETVINIVGDTTYKEGKEYRVLLTDVYNTMNNRLVPIHYIATYTATTDQTIGTKSDDYFNNRGNNNSIYTISEEGLVTSGKTILIGFLPKGNMGINGTLTIKTWINYDDLGISSSPDEIGSNSDEQTVKWNIFIGRKPISFKIKTEVKNGVWVTDPNTDNNQIPSCPGCKFIYTTNTYYFSGSKASTMLTFAKNNEALVGDYTTLNMDKFLGFKIENDKVVKAYACGIFNSNDSKLSHKNGTPFCLEGSTNDSTWMANAELLNGETGLWNGTCYGWLSYLDCIGPVGASADNQGYVYVRINNDLCYVDFDGRASCD